MKPVKGLKTTTKSSTPKTTATRRTKPVTKAAAKKNNPTTIEAHIDVGYGNNLFVRGEGAGLSWDQGVPLKCVTPDTWEWTGPISEKMRFKILLNDSVWSRGDDLVAKPGERVRLWPVFW